MDTNPEATASDFLLKKTELETDVETVTTKVNSPRKLIRKRYSNQQG